MYAPLQQAWTREVMLSPSWMEQYAKALMVFLASFSLFGWTYALIALGLFCGYQKRSSNSVRYQFTFSPSHLVWRIIDCEGGCQTWAGRPESVAVGWCYMTFRLQQRDITIWQWQMSSDEWRRLRALALQIWVGVS